MKKNTVLITISLSLACFGCSNKQLYEAFQPKYDETECRKEHESEFENCMRKQAITYEEYEKERKSIIKQQ